ncbi:uncharacterized protein NECHADRAFT_79660 [Fusarium vanettenii 77-13-4]|uniref:Uncharacterized protein n=1 Tax=Fusarium vanettenii (strain ATCC MYA-4622 / CBS 123669 / FGSC 9596 / NRRL 45880 / 77-13-4) TaxID=660122 RepID=C7Z845_FUSV7|nr:uncharacterized protein NECHADRAFT_79660 [Fusarium vanettenii 77-13-4]EEU39807.1 predicted protein [Fusarium vanettenii 77-13-4]
MPLESSFTSHRRSLKVLEELASLRVKKDNAPHEPRPDSGRGDGQPVPQSIRPDSTQSITNVGTRIQNGSVQDNPPMPWLSRLVSCREQARLIFQAQQEIYDLLQPREAKIKRIMKGLETQMAICVVQQHELTKKIDVLERERQEPVDVHPLLDQALKKLSNALAELRDITSAIRTLIDTPQHPKVLIKKLNALEFPIGDRGTKLCRLSLRDRIERITRTLMSFKELRERLSTILEMHQREPLTPAEKQMLSRLGLCQKTTIYLCRQLSQVCPEHDEHEVYFNLNVHEDLQQKSPAFGFHLAFKAMHQRENSTNLIWFRATSTSRQFEIDELNKLRRPAREHVGSRPRGVSKRTAARLTTQTTHSRPRPTQRKQTISPCLPSRSGLCLSNYGQRIGGWAADLDDLPEMLDPKTGTLNQNRLDFPDKPPREEIHPVPLSQWVNDNSHETMPDLAVNLMRVKVARLLCEAVLRFTPEVWPKIPFSSESIMILNSINCEIWDPHFTVKLAGRSGPEQLFPAAGGTSNREILHGLGITLLELAHRKHVPGLRTNGAGEIDRRHSSYAQVRKLRNATLNSILSGTHFRRAVDYCMDSSSLRKDLDDLELWEGFYQAVVVSLEKTEESISLSLDDQREFEGDDWGSGS